MTTWKELPSSHREFIWIRDKMKNTIRQHNSGRIRDYNIIKIEKIDNIHHWRRYARKKRQIERENGGEANERWLFHGTDKADVILANGFDVKHASPYGMFGPGLYFARDSSKSDQYVFGKFAICDDHGNSVCEDCERKMLLSRVCLGRTKEETSTVRRNSAPSGYHSVKGVAGVDLQFSEFVVYENDQVCLRYLITYKAVKDVEPAAPADNSCAII